MGCGGGGWVSSPEKKIIFCPQNDKFGFILMQFLTDRKHGQSLEALGHGCCSSFVKQSLQKQCRNYPKVHGQTRSGQLPHPFPSEYAISSSSCRMRVIYHNWSATKQRPHPQSVAEISRHSVLSGDRIQQCEKYATDLY